MGMGMGRGGWRLEKVSYSVRTREGEREKEGWYGDTL